MLKTFFIILTTLLLSYTSMAQQQDGSVLERRISISEQNQPVSYILEQLSWQANVFFSYNAALINADDKRSIDVSGKSLFNVLMQLFDTQKFNFSELDNQVIISEKEKIQIAEKDTLPLKYFFLSGKIIDSKKGDPIKYASVSLYNYPIGTISNEDGEFLLKIHPNHILDTIVISCMAYSQILTPANLILDEDLFIMNPISIKIKEIKVTATTPKELLDNIRKSYEVNYSNSSRLMTAFYRETVKQNDKYINVSEAVLELLKAPYSNALKNDVIKLTKGRKSPNVQPFKWINFKLQGGPFTMTKLDVVKTTERFIDPEYEKFYKYNITKVIWYNNHPVYVLAFEPQTRSDYPEYIGEMYVHRETFAIVHAHFKLAKNSLWESESALIKKKPKGVRARPTFVEYTVNYQKFNGKWHLAAVQASIKIRIKSKRDRLNSEFHSVSDLLVTDIQNTTLKRFHRTEALRKGDVFVEMIDHYDEHFWENYNTIKPDEDLRNAFKGTTKSTK